MIVVELPGMRLVNGTNDRGHWAKKAARARHQRGSTRLVVATKLPPRTRRTFPVVVTIVRFGLGTMDDDGLAASAKHTRDGVADALEVDDGDTRIAWRYEQRKSKTVGVEVRIEFATAKGA